MKEDGYPNLRIDAPNIWQQTLDLLRERGWTRTPNRAQRALCVGEAIAVVITGDRDSLYPHIVGEMDDRHPLRQAYRTFADHTGAKQGLLGQWSPQPPLQERIMYWNDKSGRKAEDVMKVLEELDRKVRTATRTYRRRRDDPPTPRMPDPILPHRTNQHGETTECQICGEPADDEMGEFALPTDDPMSVVAHAQCGIDHGLEMA